MIEGIQAVWMLTNIVINAILIIILLRFMSGSLKEIGSRIGVLFYYIETSCNKMYPKHKYTLEENKQ